VTGNGQTARDLLRKARDGGHFPRLRDCYSSYSLILILRKTLFTSQPLRLKHIKFTIASVHQQSKSLRHIKQAKQTLQRKQSCVQEQSFACVTLFYRYGFVWYFLSCIFVRLYLILSSFFAVTPVVTGNERRARDLRLQGP
jgi:hypothetical protein